MTISNQLESRALKVLSGEIERTVEVLEVLNEMYKAKVWLERGYKSFHCYCVERLRMSEDSAARRLHVAELLERYPKLLRPLLLQRRVHISGMALLHAIITDDNAERLITEAAGKSRRYIETMRVRERPKSDVSTGMQRQPVLNCQPQPQVVERTPASVSTPAPLQIQAPAPVEETKQQFKFEARSPGRRVYRTMTSDETRDGYERIKELTGKTDEELFAEMVQVYETELLKKKHAQVERPQTTMRPRQDEQDIPASVKRAVFQRDKGQCQHTGTDGHICGSRKHLHYHHIIPRAAGGPATPENISLRCAAHNLYQATLDFGADLITNVIADKQRKRRTGAESLPSEVREPRARYSSKRRRGTVQSRTSAFHATSRQSRTPEPPQTPAWSRPTRRNAIVSK